MQNLLKGWFSIAKIHHKMNFRMVSIGFQVNLEGGFGGDLVGNLEVDLEDDFKYFQFRR